MFGKALIANRGEIACRIIKTARKMGIYAVGVYSKADAQALHVRMSDEAWAIGPSPPRESYLAADKLVDVALKCGAEALHPGYGFLSESAEFSERCRQAGFVFIGPSPETMHAVGNKAEAKRLMARIGVPVLPGFNETAQDLQTFADAAKRVGFPVVIKASAGGGGRGMRVVDRLEDLAEAVESARREALLAFGDGHLLVEKYLDRPRHVEVQFAADRFGGVVVFPERDCSLQRNHQKLVEESPATGLSPDLRRALGEAAREIALASSYVGVGTAEFLVKDGSFYFLEVNARLQVEHPVTEMVSGLDLVEWQFRIASGEKLPLQQDQLRISGSAIEARICAEDPSEGFRPSSGVLRCLKFPCENPAVRVDTGFQTFDAVSPYYDSLLGKLIVRDETRAGAISKMQKALAETELVGVSSNLDLLRTLVSDPCVVAGGADTDFVGRMPKSEGDPPTEEFNVLLAAAVVAWREEMRRKQLRYAEEDGRPWSPWARADGWRLHAETGTALAFCYQDKILQCRIGLIDERTFWMEAPARLIVSGSICGDRLQLCVDGRQRELGLVSWEGAYVVLDKGRNHILRWQDPLTPRTRQMEEEKSFLAPLPARVTRVFVSEGDHILKGTPVLLLEAMKMEIAVEAPRDGMIEKILCNEGQSVREGEKLVAMSEAR